MDTTAITHYESLKRFLAKHLAREQANGSRTNAREKLTKLTKQQFQELSTDVYDELSRRLLDTNEVPFLPVKDEFHPKRNQARQKLATLPQNRFKDLASDVYYELERRYPELKDIEFPTPRSNNQSPQPISQQNKTSPEVRSQASKPNNNNIVPEMSTLRKEPVDFHIQKQNNRPEAQNVNSDADNTSQKNTTNTTQKPHAIATSNTNNTNNTGNYPPVPDSVPPEYGSPRSTSTRSRTQSSASSVSDFGRRYANGMSVSSVSSVNTPNRDTVSSQRSNKPPETVNFASLDSLMADLGDLFDNNKSTGSAGSSPKQAQGQSFPHAEVEKVKSEYELRIVNLQKRIRELESELSTKGNSSENDSIRVIELEKQLEEQKRINKRQALKMTELEQEFDKLTEDHHQQQEIANDVQKEATGLLEEIKEISKRNDELYAEKEADSARIKALTAEVNEWKSKYDKARTELRNFKATSTFFSAPKVDILNNNSLAPTPDGAIEESKIVSYQVAIDELLRAGRSDQPTNVLMAMKSIVIACKSMTEEVENYEQRRGASMNGEEKSNLDICKAKLSATLKNLTTAAKNHATGYGISPVSLLDAAASHLTSSVVDLVKAVKLRRDRRQSEKLNSDILPYKIQSETMPTNNEIASLRSKNNQGEINSGANGAKAVDIDELKDFLERQTEAIVQAIHTLLQIIRGGTYSGGGDLTDNVNTITTIVLTVISVCHDSFESSDGASYRTRGSVILKALENNVDKLDEMKDLIASDSTDFMSNKNSKQRLASASFEIAKFTKELVSLVKKDDE